MRYDFAERLDKSRLDFRWEMLQKIDAAIEKGVSRRARGKEEVEERKQRLFETARKLDIISTRLIAIKEQTGGTHA